jgi:hypothetical protein
VAALPIVIVTATDGPSTTAALFLARATVSCQLLYAHSRYLRLSDASRRADPASARSGSKLLSWPRAPRDIAHASGTMTPLCVLDVLDCH